MINDDTIVNLKDTKPLARLPGVRRSVRRWHGHREGAARAIQLALFARRQRGPIEARRIE